MDWLAAFGARASGERLARMRASPHFRDGAFENPIPTRKMLPGSSGRMLARQLRGGEERVPLGPLPIVALDRFAFATPPKSGLRATWLGHSTTLLEIDGACVLLDPVWAEHVSPVPLAGPRRFHAPPLALDQLPVLDAVIISHDHYDHLDMHAVRSLASDDAQRRARFILPLGVGAHLEHWGVAPERITELDWREEVRVGALTIGALPARHFSGRSLGDLVGRGNPTLWASWSIAGPRHHVFFSGDTGPFDGFAEVGRHHGPFDLTLIKIGAYDELWPDVHLTPEQAIALHLMVRGRVMLPIHWGTFKLALHARKEPPERAVRAANERGVTLTVPRPGQSIEPAQPPAFVPWWRSVARS